jgi:hypothetical protein
VAQGDEREQRAASSITSPRDVLIRKATFGIFANSDSPISCLHGSANFAKADEVNCCIGQANG